MSITANDLFEVCKLNSDAVSGFLAQVKTGSRCTALWPEHLTDVRYENWMKGCALAKQWLAMRRGYQIARRQLRARDFKEVGITSTLLPGHRERRQEQLECLISVCRSLAADRHD